ncbi:MAG: DUF1572 family protein [Gemmatimonadaceae bacterium]
MSIEVRFLERSRYYLGVEYPAKIRTAIMAMPEDRLWWRPNEDSNSAGNLVMHLAGNVRQWIVSGVGGGPDVRRRDVEFATRGGISAEALVDHLERTLSEVDAVLARLAPEDLLTRRAIQGRDTTVFSAIYHVVEHFSTHTGQIVWLGKMLAPSGAIRFYDDANNAAPLFLEDGRGDID